jgi:hypothetical protein
MSFFTPSPDLYILLDDTAVCLGLQDNKHKCSLVAQQTKYVRGWGLTVV